MLSITIELTREEEQEVRRRFVLRDRVGLQHILADALVPAVESLLEQANYTRPNFDEFEQLSRLLAEKSDAYMPVSYQTLPAEAISRSGIYEE